MHTTALIGLGTITRHYVAGLEASAQFTLGATADINENAPSRVHYASLPFYTDYKQLLRTHSPELAIISTPPETHYEIALYCLEHGVGVLVEKPAVLKLDELDSLQKAADERGLIFSTMFHWQGGIEVTELSGQYDLSDIRRLDVRILDPYCDDGEHIREDKVALRGAWIDSGVNALSMISCWLPLERATIKRCDCIRDKYNQLPIHAKAELMIDECRVCIEIDWTKHRDHKQSTIETKDRMIRIDHSAQSIDDGSVKTSCARTERLDEHYIAVFDSIKDNGAESRTIHKLLMEVDQRL